MSEFISTVPPDEAGIPHTRTEVKIIDGVPTDFVVVDFGKVGKTYRILGFSPSEVELARAQAFEARRDTYEILIEIARTKLGM